MAGAPVVVDASILVQLLLALPGHRRIAQRLVRASTLHAPHLVDLEVMSAIRKAMLRGLVPDAIADRAMTEIGALSLHRYPHAPLRPRIWELRHTVTPYDAAYLALAEVLDAPLLTLDARLRTAPGHGAVVEVLDGSTAG